MRKIAMNCVLAAVLLVAAVQAHVGIEYVEAAMEEPRPEPLPQPWKSGETTVTLKNGTLRVSGKGAMADYDSLDHPWNDMITRLVIEKGVTHIGNRALAYACDLTSVTIPNSVTSIGKGAFEYCDNLTSVTIPNSVTSIGGGAFAACEGLASVKVAADNPHFVSEDGILFNKDKTALIHYPMRRSGPYVIPNSVTTIGNWAFEGCRLTSVTIPNSVTTIGDGAFAGCRLTSVTIPNSVTTIGDEAFAGCGLTSVTIPNSVTTIGDGAFEQCYRLASVTIGNGVASIGNEAFNECYDLASVTIPNGVTSIGNEAFNKCYGLASVTIPNSVTTIGDRAFAECGLKSVTIGNGVTSIGKNAFAACRSLKSIKAAKDNAYYRSANGVLFDKNNTTLIQYPAGRRGPYRIPDGVKFIGEGAFMNCDSLTSVRIPNSVTAIGESAFESCYNLTSATIGNSVMTIGDAAFKYCYRLKSVTIPGSVTSIGKSAFWICPALTSIRAQSPAPPKLGNGAFDYDGACCTYNAAPAVVYVPEGYANAYRSADGWGNFRDIVPIAMGGDEPAETGKFGAWITVCIFSAAVFITVRKLRKGKYRS